MGELYKKIVKMAEGMKTRPVESKTHGVYVAFVPLSQRTLVKVGMSMRPLNRIYEVNCGSPFGVSHAIYTFVGSKETALIIEAGIHRGLRKFKTRGEWFMLSGDADMKKLDSTCRAVVREQVGEETAWQHADILEIRDACEKAFRFKHQPKNTQGKKCA